MTSPSIFGTGYSFPFRLDSNGAKISFTREEELVWEAMDALLNTSVDERPFLIRNGVPYGTLMRRAAFESVQTAIDIAKFDIPRALRTWEPRIVVRGEVDASPAEEVDGKRRTTFVVANIPFIFRSTNRSDNFVIPYRITLP